MVSRQSWTLPRWARTSSGVDQGSPDVVEPPSQQKNVGWLSTDNPVREWWNWIWRETHKGLLYFDEWVTNAFPANQLARTGEVAGQFGCTTGSQQAAIGSGTAFIAGNRYEFPATVVLANTQSSQAVMHRIVVARLVAGVPTIVLLDGPSSGVDPTLLAGDVALWRLKQNTGSATIASTNDLREWGVYEGSRVSADDELSVTAPNFWVGPVGTEMLRIYESGANVVAEIRSDATHSWVFTGGVGGYRVRRIAVHGSLFVPTVGTPSRNDVGVALAASTDVLRFAVPELPANALLHKLQVGYSAGSGTNDATISVIHHDAESGSILYSESIVLNNESSGTRTETKTLIDTPISDGTVTLKIAAGTNHGITVHSVTLEIWQPDPFASYPTLT